MSIERDFYFNRAFLNWAINIIDFVNYHTLHLYTHTLSVTNILYNQNI